MNVLTRITRPWDYNSGVHSCATCNGLGTVAASRRPSTWDPYPEVACDDCGSREGPEPCEVCGSELHVPGYDCIVCQMVDELPRHALADGEALATAIKSAMGARLAAEQVRA